MCACGSLNSRGAGMYGFALCFLSTLKGMELMINSLECQAKGVCQKQVDRWLSHEYNVDKELV